MHLLRGIFSASGLWFYFYMFSYLPIATSSALVQTSVIFLMLVSAIFLREIVSWDRWAAGIFGFLGVFVILRPVGDSLHLGYVAPLIVALLHALTIATTRSLATRDPPETVLFYATLIAVAVWAVPGLLAWRMPSNSEWLPVAGVAVFGALALYFAVLAYRTGEASALAPFDYLRLVLNTTMAAILFDQIPDIWTIVGAIMIVGSSALLFVANQSKTSVIRVVGRIGARLWSRLRQREEYP